MPALKHRAGQRVTMQSGSFSDFELVAFFAMYVRFSHVDWDVLR